MQPGELSRKVPRAKQQLPLPRSGADARREVTWRRLMLNAKRLDCEKQFEQDQGRKNYPAAFLDYHNALWKRVEQQTPREVIDRLREAGFVLPDTPENQANISVALHEYMLWRAIFVAGMKAGEGFNPDHYRHFSQLAQVADRIDDDKVFRIAAQRRWNAKTAKVQEGRTQMERQTKYCLLISWVAGGLWCKASRAEQMVVLRKLWPTMPKYTPEAISTAQKRLGLRWPVT